MTEEEIELVEVTFQKVFVKPGDVVVVMFDRILSKDAREHVIRVVEANFPDNKAIILEEGMKIGVMAMGGDSEEPWDCRGFGYR